VSEDENPYAEIAEAKYTTVLKEIFDKCLQIVREKRELYQDAWYDMEWRTLDGVIAYRAKRLMRIPHKYLDKIIQEHIHIVNLSIMALVKLYEEAKRRGR